MSNVPSNQITLLRKAAQAVYLAAAEGPANDLSRLITGAADEIERLRAALRDVSAEVSAVGCEGADDAICVETTRAKEDWCPYCRIGTIVQNASSSGETGARHE